MRNVITFNGITRLDIDPDVVLDAAQGKLSGVVLLGYDKNGEEYFATSYADGGDALWLLERLKKQLLEMGDENTN